MAEKELDINKNSYLKEFLKDLKGIFRFNFSKCF